MIGEAISQAVLFSRDVVRALGLPWSSHRGDRVLCPNRYNNSFSWTNPTDMADLSHVICIPPSSVNGSSKNFSSTSEMRPPTSIEDKDSLKLIASRLEAVNLSLPNDSDTDSGLVSCADSDIRAPSYIEKEIPPIPSSFCELSDSPVLYRPDFDFPVTCNNTLQNNSTSFLEQDVFHWMRDSSANVEVHDSSSSFNSVDYKLQSKNPDHTVFFDTNSGGYPLVHYPKVIDNSHNNPNKWHSSQSFTYCKSRFHRNNNACVNSSIDDVDSYFDVHATTPNVGITSVEQLRLDGKVSIVLFFSLRNYFSLERIGW